MKVLQDNFKNKIKDKTIITLGSFDGLHLGHRRLIETTIEKAKNLRLKSFVYTFKNHPLSILDKSKEPSHLITISEKKDILKSYGIDIVNFVNIDSEYLKLSARDFVEKLVSLYNMKAIVVGYNNRFGHKNSGDINLLKEMSKEYDFSVFEVPKFSYGDINVSSTKIRMLIENGEIELAKKLLDRYYSLDGKVVQGKQIGRTINFPTANLSYKKEMVIPKKGVYYTNIMVNNKIYKGITNIGYNPTVNGSDKTIETYILDFDKDIYGEEIKVYFIKFIRDEVKFSSLDQLKSRLKIDKDIARNENLKVSI